MIRGVGLTGVLVISLTAVVSASLVAAGLTAPVALASGGGEGCSPARPGYGDGVHSQVGVQTPGVTNLVGGAYADITQYSPYTLHSGSGTQSWVLLDGQGQLAQVGWAEVLGGNRYTIAMSSPDNVHYPYNFWPGEPLTPIPQKFYYTGLYNNYSGNPNTVTFAVNGQTLMYGGQPWMAQDQNGNPLHFQPQQAESSPRSIRRVIRCPGTRSTKRISPTCTCTGTERGRRFLRRVPDRPRCTAHTRRISGRLVPLTTSIHGIVSVRTPRPP